MALLSMSKSRLQPMAQMSSGQFALEARGGRTGVFPPCTEDGREIVCGGRPVYSTALSESQKTLKQFRCVGHLLQVSSPLVERTRLLHAFGTIQ